MLPWRPCSPRLRFVDSLLDSATLASRSPSGALPAEPTGARLAGGTGGGCALDTVVPPAVSGGPLRPPRRPAPFPPARVGATALAPGSGRGGEVLAVPHGAGHV